MNRRAFLSLSSLVAAGMVLDPERLLWVPGQKNYFFVHPQPIAKPSIAELVALVYEKVVIERAKDGQLFWNDSAMIHQFAQDAVLRGT